MFQSMTKVVDYYIRNYNPCQMRKFGEEFGFTGSFVWNFIGAAPLAAHHPLQMKETLSASALEPCVS